MTARSCAGASSLRTCLRCLRLLLLLVVSLPAAAWNAAGHRISAMVAWQTLDGETRAAIAEVLRQHPDFESWQAHANGADPDLTAFVEASTWPDDIRRDRRFYTAGVDEPTATEPGFPDMERHLHWHYLDRPLNPGARVWPSPGIIDRQLAALARIVGDPQGKISARAYALPWLIHLVGDAHQPLHTASRYALNGQSDNGGNQTTIINPFAAHPSMTLHRYWDDLPGPPWLRGSRLESAVDTLTSLYPRPASAGTPEQWIDESWRIARQHAYPLDGSAVPTISERFHESALAIARSRVTLAGYRLADILQHLFRAAEPQRKRP